VSPDRRGRLAGTAGFTLVELLAAVAVSLVVVGVVTGTVIQGLQTQRRQVDQVEALNAAKLAFERVTRDLRAADPLLIAEPDRVRVGILRAGASSVVTYWREGDRLLARTGTGEASLLVDGVVPAADPVFAFHLFDGTDVGGSAVADPRRVRSVTVTLRVERPWAGAVVNLDTRVLLRNAG
jgi:prepilin-type N-terminal cleavage/methylation domain-containing protein